MMKCPDGQSDRAPHYGGHKCLLIVGVPFHSCIAEFIDWRYLTCGLFLARLQVAGPSPYVYTSTGAKCTIFLELSIGVSTGTTHSVYSSSFLYHLHYRPTKCPFVVDIITTTQLVSRVLFNKIWHRMFIVVDLPFFDPTS